MSDKTIKVSNTADLRTAIEAGYTKDQIEVAQPDTSAAVTNAFDAGMEKGKTAGLDEGRKLGAQQERDRIAAINDLTLKGFEKERDEALKSGATANDFAVTQAKAIKDRGVTVSAIQKDSSVTPPHAGAPHDDAATAEANASWARTVAKYSGGKK